jgi:hypothetical protein
LAAKANAIEAGASNHVCTLTEIVNLQIETVPLGWGRGIHWRFIAGGGATLGGYDTFGGIFVFVAKLFCGRGPVGAIGAGGLFVKCSVIG